MMRPALTAGAATLALLLAALIAACQDGEEPAAEPSSVDVEAGAAIAARLMTVGEPLGTVVESRAAAIVPGLQVALNPTVVAVIASAVEAADERLTSIAAVAGMEPAAFAELWDADRDDAFARFAAGIAATEDPSATADDLFIDLPVALPVHPQGELLGSVLTKRTNGELAFFIVYDTPDAQIDAERLVGEQVDQSPWQVTGARSSEDLGFFQFQNTISADVSGFAWILPRTPNPADAATEADARGDGDAAGDGDTATEELGPPSTVIYLIQTQPAIPPEEPAYELPEHGRPLPERFPAASLLEGDQTVTELFWSSQPGVSGYQLSVLVSGSSFDIADLYRERIEAEGWEIIEDQAVGFSTILEFASEDRSLQGSASFDTFEENEAYTQITLQIQSAGASPN
ncbi:MAG: hypothetical protein F4056_10000 [Chloroflexi bacterium]|nr:hypothetical protein [Chloroflexota bacterium]